MSLKTVNKVRAVIDELNMPPKDTVVIVLALLDSTGYQSVQFMKIEEANALELMQFAEEIKSRQESIRLIGAGCQCANG